jgi:hypothetical protein
MHEVQRGGPTKVVGRRCASGQKRLVHDGYVGADGWMVPGEII